MKSSTRSIGRAAALVLAALMGATVATALATARVDSSERIEAEAPELPREWRWERAPITFDHMFMPERGR